MTKSELQGWRVVAGLSVVAAVILGTTICTMGMFLSPIMDAFGSTNARASQATTFFILAMTLTMPGLGWLIDQVGARIVMTAGAAVAAAGYVVAATSQDIGTYIAAMTLAGAGVGASTYVPGTLVIANWIDRNRGLAMGLFMAATALGSAIFPMLVAHLLSDHSWRTTQLWIAGVIAIVTVPTLLSVARTRPNSESARADALGDPITGLGIGKGLRTRAFWLLGITQMLAGLSFQGVYLYIVPYLLGAGYSSAEAALLFGAANLMSVGGFLVFGTFADRAGPKRAFAIGLLTCGLSTLLLLAISDPFHGVAAAVAFAVSWGATCTLSSQLVPMLLAEAVGLRDFGSLLGMNYLMYGLAMAVGPLITGNLYDLTHSYAAPFRLFAILMTVAALPVLLLRSDKVELTQPTPPRSSESVRRAN